MENQTNNDTTQNDFVPQNEELQSESMQPDMGSQPGFDQPDMNSQPGFDQPGMNEQQGYGQPDMNGQQNYGQPSYGQPNMNGQMGYGQPGMNGQPGYGQPNMNGQMGYGQPGMGPQGGYYQQNPGGGNYYQAPGGNGYYPNQQPQEKKNGGVIALIVGVVVLILLLIVAVVLMAVSAMRSDKKLDSDGNDYDYYDDYDDDDDYDYDDDYGFDYDDDDYDYDYEDDYGDGYDPLAFVDDIDWNDKDWMKEPKNHTPDQVGRNGVYFELANCIDKDVSYSMTHTNYEETERENDVCIRVNYYQLEGDIPNLDDLNKELEDYAMYYGSYYDKYYDDFQEIFEEDGKGFVCTTEAYITYNDESMISVVYDVYYETATIVDKRIVCVNIDLESGTVIRNTDILDVTDDFIEDYKEVCEDQNGRVSAFSYFDDDELEDYFEDEDNLILYYTPIGLEVGFNYETNTSYGWVTATLEDYEQYLRSY